ncbi:hypothetical protein TNCV_2315501 [Trichonephila clavipes]|nr:hypothetical protein TNCV_2315501 [Trichonephila clavipes]
MVFFLDVTGIKPCPDLSPNQNALRIASGTEPTLIRKEDTTPLISCPVFCALCTTVNGGVGGQLSMGGSVQDGRQIGPLFEGVWPHCRPRVATTNLSNSCTYGLERFPRARNDTFVDSELCSYTGDDTPLLQLSDHSSTCEVVQAYSAHLSIRDLDVEMHEQMCESGGQSEIVRVHYFVRGGFAGNRSRASSKHLSPHLPVGELDSSGGQTGVALHLKRHVWASGLQRNRPDVDVFEK